MGGEAKKSAGDFSFPYNKENVRECLISTEKELRNIIHLLLSEKFGLGWETNPEIGFDAKQQQKLRLSQDEEMKRTHSHSNTGRLIDYTYIQDLADLVHKHWSQIFTDLLPWSRHNADYVFGVLLNYRDILMHGRDENVPDHRKYLCLGFCGEILYAISEWYAGYRPTRDISSYQCHLFISVSKEDPECETKARSLTGQWIDAIDKYSSSPRQKKDDDGRFEYWLLRLTEGSIRLKIDKRLNYRSEQVTGKPLKLYCGIDLTLETESVLALDRIIVNGRRPFWCIRMEIKGRYDLEIIKSNAEHIGKHVDVSRVWSRTKGSSISSISFVLFEEYGEIYPVPKFHIGVDIRSGSSESGSTVVLIYQSDNIKEGFYQAHKVMLPNTVLSILYNKMTGPEIRQMVSTALSLPLVE